MPGGRHAHSVLLYCTRGGGHVEMSGRYELEAGSILLIPGWVTHRLQLHKETQYRAAIYHEAPPALRDALERVRQGAAPVQAPSFLQLPPLKAPDWVSQAVQHVFEHHSKLEEIAQAVGVSPAHLTSQVKRWTGKSLGQWQLQARLEYAALLVKNSTVREAAEASGFGDLSHFRKLFRRHYGQSPQEYRQGDPFHV